MRTAPILVLVAVVAVGAVGCAGGDDDSTIDPIGSSTPTSDAAVAAPPTAGGSDLDGDAVGCGDLGTDDLALHGISVQVLASIDDAASLDAAGGLGYDGVRYATVLDEMHDVVSGDADAVAAVEFFQQLNDRATALTTESSEADFADYVDMRGEPGDVIVRQAPLNAALRDACPDL